MVERGERARGGSPCGIAVEQSRGRDGPEAGAGLPEEIAAAERQAAEATAVVVGARPGGGLRDEDEFLGVEQGVGEVGPDGLVSRLLGERHAVLVGLRG